MKKEIIELRKVMEGHKMTGIQMSAVEWVFKQALLSQQATIRREVEELNKCYSCVACETKGNSLSHTLQCNYKDEVLSIIDKL